MNVIRATLNKKTYKSRPKRLKNAPMFQTLNIPPRTPRDQTSGSLQSSNGAFTLNNNQGQVLSTAERNSGSSRSTEQAFRTPCLSAMFKNRSVNSNNPEITNELVAECLNISDKPLNGSSNSKISDRQKELLQSVPPPCPGSGRKPRSSTSSGARPRSTPTPSHTGTPRTPRTPKTLSSLESAQNMIIAITEGRGLARGEVGIAALDIHSPYLIMSQISDCQTYTNTMSKINVLHPTEILVPNTFIDTQEKNKLFTLIHETFPQVLITTVQRRHFSDNIGLQLVQSLCLTEYANVEMVVRQKFYALSATSALLKYIEFQKNKIFMPKSLRIEYHSPENVMSIDMKTAQKLELVLSLNGRGSKGSLLGVLDHCSTWGGKRSLRANILQPPTTLELINSRLLSVTELAQNPTLLYSLQSVVSKFHDVEQLLWLSVQVPNFKDEQKASELQTNFVLLLKTTLDTLPVLKESLQPAQTPYFKKVLKDLDHEKFGIISNTIMEVVNEDAKTKKGYSASTFQRCFAIKTGINGLLDVARASYSDIVAKVHARVGEMGEEFGLPLRTCSTSSKGFHIQLSIKRNEKFSAKDLPSVFIQVARNRNLITMTTEELVVLNHRIKQILLEIQMMSNVIMQELLRKLRMHISCLYHLCEIISELDLLISFSQVSSADHFAPPNFGNEMDVKSSRHPILDAISASTPVANNVIGCFVPAESAKFRITKQILSRMGFDDSIEYNASSFVMEMKEMQYILRSARSECLIVIDELCRSTDSEEGTAVAWVLCEQLLQSKAFVFFTTHYHTLSKLQTLYPNVSNHQMVAEDGAHGRLVYTHKLMPGVTKVAMYGLKLAQLSALPTLVLRRAQELYDSLTKNKLETPVHDEKKTDAEEDQEYIKELLYLLEDKRFILADVSKIQMKLRKRYGLDVGDRHASDVSEISEGSTGSNINHEHVHDDPRSPELLTNLYQSDQDDALSVRSNQSKVTQGISPTPCKTSALVRSGSEHSPLHVSPNIQDIGANVRNSSQSRPENRFPLSNVSPSSQFSNPKNPNEHMFHAFKVPLDLKSQRISYSSKSGENVRINSRNSSKASSMESIRNDNREENSPINSWQFGHQTPGSVETPLTSLHHKFESEIQQTNNEDVSLLNYRIKSPIITHTLLNSPTTTEQSIINLKSPCEHHTQSGFRSPGPTIQQTSLFSSRRSFDCHDDSKNLPPVFDKSSKFRNSGGESNHERNIWLQESLTESLEHRVHFMAEDFVPSPRPTPFSQTSSNIEPLSGRAPNNSPFSSRSNTPMVLNLFPSFEDVPRNLIDSDSDQCEDRKLEE
ncbi:mutS protein homolog 4-like isoform X2 [Macrosteles quadrilineatus]|uniref:mutS protein homolog 4-like isoform X2 n=1 Tax=Macrosteles quadrilineatus TaxID=74068 RepID=UPI0023E27CB3|nr:mutS protein homolog 4-like isoform X2 [Macrosteles quadrilineatus]